MARINRTVKYIKLLKKKFGKKFHTHLYAPLNLITKKNLGQLSDAGLDELRLHPGLYNKKNWEKIALASPKENKKYKWDLGLEIPAIPGQEKMIKELIDYSAQYIRFLNLNELEVSDTNAQHLFEHGLHTKQNHKKVDYGIDGSQELAKKLLRYTEKKHKHIAVHYCTTTLKDKVQLAERIKRRAKNTAKKYDIITKDGLLYRGAIYLKELQPTFSYRKQIDRLTAQGKKKLASQLDKIRKDIMKEYELPAEFVAIDNTHHRILLPYFVVNEIKDDLKAKKLVPAIVEEYPTWDNFQVEVIVL